MDEDRVKDFEVEQVLKTLSDEDTRIKVAYDMYSKMDLVLKATETKDFDIAIKEKNFGNECFEKKQFKEALQHYNTGIRNCPQDTDEGRLLLSVLTGHRSLVNFEFEKYEEAILDIAYVEQIGRYPSQMKCSLYWRKAKCYEAIADFNSADAAFDEALKWLMQDCNIKEDERQRKRKAIQNCKAHKKAIPGKPMCANLTWLNDMVNFQGGKKYVATIPQVDFKYDSVRGRYAVAKGDIPIGTLILKEEAHVAVLIAEKNLTHCQYCFSSVDRPLPCSTCASVVFCSPMCRKKAEETFHGIECSIFGNLQDYEVNKYLALRIITQKGFSFFNDQKSRLLELLSGIGTRDQGLTEKEVYRSEDYENMLFLFRNEGHGKEYEIFIYKSMVDLLRVLKQSNFFPHETSDKVLLAEELLIAKLILRHLKMTRYNVHEMNEINSLGKKFILRNGVDTYFDNFQIGAAVYPTLAFFNHSCEPYFVRTNKNRTIFARTIKPISAGDIIFDNYGPNFLWTCREDRQKTLQTDYCFRCTCLPCLEDWSWVEEIDTVYKVPCQTKNCSVVFSVIQNKPRPERCCYCLRKLYPQAVSDVTMALTRYTQEAEVIYQRRKYAEAMQKFIEILEIKYKYTTIPDLHIVQTQERIELCMDHLGNRSCDYPYYSQF